MLFLLAAGLTLVFGIMDCINLAHGSLYMVGAYFVAAAAQATDSFWIGLAVGVAATARSAWPSNFTLFRRLYRRDHLSPGAGDLCPRSHRQRGGAGRLGRPASSSQPAGKPGRAGGVRAVRRNLLLPAYRLLIIAFGLAVALGLYLLVARSRSACGCGREPPTGRSPRPWGSMSRRCSAVFVAGAGLCALAGGLLRPLLAVRVGMGSDPSSSPSSSSSSAASGRSAAPSSAASSSASATPSAAPLLPTLLRPRARRRGVDPGSAWLHPHFTSSWPASSSSGPPRACSGPGLMGFYQPAPIRRPLPGCSWLPWWPPFALEAAGQGFYIGLVSRIMIFALAATSLNLVLGFGGLFSSAMPPFSGAGACASAILMAAGVGEAFVACRRSWRRQGCSPWRWGRSACAPGASISS